MNHGKRYKVSDTVEILVELLTIRELGTIVDALTLLSNHRHDWSASERELIWETRRMMDAAHTQAVTNEYAGDYDYPEQEGLDND